MTPLVLYVALAAAVPTADPQVICRDARAAAAAADQATAFSACVHDEQAARDQLRKNWAHFPASARATCSEPEAVAISYVEVLTCLEMESGANFSGGVSLQPPIAPSPVKPGPGAAEPKP
jgi:hypothetical protein